MLGGKVEDGLSEDPKTRTEFWIDFSGEKILFFPSERFDIRLP